MAGVTPLTSVFLAKNWVGARGTCHLDGVFDVAQQSARRMLAGAGGVIINMGSTSGLNGYPRYADYNAAKAGVVGLTRTMALELAPTIRVTAVCPGYVWTAILEPLLFEHVEHGHADRPAYSRLLSCR